MKKILAALAAIPIALGLALFGAAPAQAHTAVLSGIAACQEDGTYKVNWTVTLSNYGDHQEIDLKVIQHSPSGSLINGVDGQVWLYEWVEHSANHGLPPFPPGGIATFTQTNIPGTATSAKTMVQYDWKNGPSGDPVKEINLPGDCEPENPPQPEDKVTYSEWVDGTWECEDTSVVQTRTRTVTPYKLVENEWVLDSENSTSSTEEQVRQLTEEEITECPIEEPPVEEPPTETPEKPELPETGVHPFGLVWYGIGALILGGLAFILKRRRA